MTRPGDAPIPESYDDEIQYLIAHHAEGELAATIISREACGLRGEEPNTEETQGLHQPHESQAECTQAPVAFKGNHGSSSCVLFIFSWTMAAKNAVWHTVWGVSGADNSALARQTAVQDPCCHRPWSVLAVYTVPVLELVWLFIHEHPN